MGMLWRSCGKSAPLLYHCRSRRCYFSTPAILLHKPTLLSCNTRISLPLSRPHSRSDGLSFFARNYAKTSRKTKNLHIKQQAKEVESDDYRMNEQITADPVRLVTDTGHQVVSRREALDYAKKLKLDLVEVQFNANPPVCKVMDYNLEKFNQKQREKERAKIKAEGLRKDECREIRFTAKTEQRDLERKAEIAKQLMDRGCRVKCMAMGTGQRILEQQLQRFLILIEDVSNVEFGPKIEQRNGYFIARHIKFGVANKKEAQQTVKSVENGMGQTERDNINKTSVSEKKKEDTAVKPKEEFLDKSAQIEEHAPVEQFKEIVDEFPSIDTAEAISNGICLSTSETKLHTANTIQQQESAVGDTNHYSEAETYLEDSSRNHDYLDQARQALGDICSAWHRYDSSNSERQFASDQSLKQCRDPSKVKGSEFLKKGHFSSPLSTNLNNGPEKQHQHGISDGKLSESASGEVTFGRIHSDQEHCAVNVGKVHSADSHFKANEKDIPDDYHINASTTSEVTKSIAEELQTTPATLNNGGATQEQRPRVQILADSLRQDLIKRGSGDQHTSKTEKRPLSDLLLKQASESRWAALRPVKPSRFDDNTNTATPSITSNFVEQLQTSYANLNNDSTVQVQQKITTRSSKIPADDQEESALKPKMQPTNTLPEQTNEFQCGTLRQVTSSHFKGDNDTGRRDELEISNAKHHANQGHHVSIIGKQIPMSSVSLPTKVLENGAPYTENSFPNAKQPASSEHEKQGYFDQNKAIQKPLDSAPKLDNNTGDSNAMSRASLRILDTKTIPLVDTKQVPSDKSPSGEGNRASSTGKQDPTDLFSKKAGSQDLVKRSSGDEHTSKTEKRPLSDLLLKQASESRWAVLRPVKPSRFDDNTNTATPSITSNFVEKLQTSYANLNNDSTIQVQQKITTGSSKIPADDQEESALKAKMQPTNTLPEQTNEFRCGTLRQVTSSHFKGDSDSGRQDELEISHHANQGHHVSIIGKQLPMSSVSLPTKVLENGAPYTKNSFPNAEQPASSEHEKQGYFDPNKAIQTPVDSTPKLDNNTGDSNAMSRASWRILDAKTIPLVDTKQVPSYESPSGEGNHASSTGKQDPTDLFSKKVSAPVGSRWGIFSQPKGYVVENQRYPAKAREEQSKEWSGVSKGPNTGASAEAQSDADPRHLHIQNQRKVPTSSMGTGKQDKKQTIRDAVDQPRQKSWGIFSMKVPTTATDDKGKSEV